MNKELKTKFCPKCGQEADRLFEGMCTECFFEKRQRVKIPATVMVKRCKRCGRYFAENTMGDKEGMIDVELRKIFKEVKPAKSGIRSINYRLENGRAYVSLKFDFDGMQKSEEHAIEIGERPIVCQYCSMAETRYYNSILQIRAPEELLEEVLGIVREKINLMVTDRMAFVSEIKQVKGGFDVYIGSKAAAAKAAREIREKYAGKFDVTTKISRKIGGKKQGKEVYRDTILILIK